MYSGECKREKKNQFSLLSYQQKSFIPCKDKQVIPHPRPYLTDTNQSSHLKHEILRYETHSAGKASRSEADTKLLHRQLSSASAWAWLRGSTATEPKGNSCFYKY